MIITEIFYGVKCNRCGDILDDGEHSFWNDECGAEENATNSEWIEDKGRHYCPNCYEYNEDDDKQIPLPEFPAYLKELNKFLKNSIVGYSVEVKETDTEFLVVKPLYNRTKLEDFEIAYITGLAGSNLISITCQKHERYTRHEVYIKLKKS